MIKRLLIISLSLSFTWLAPMDVSAAPEYLAGVMEMAFDGEPTISYSDGALNIIGGEGQTLEVISLTGKKVMTVAIDSPAQKIELNIPKGCYIVKVGKVVRKVSVR